MHRITKLKLAELNPCLTCRLCGGYYVDACTIQECLHSFCKSCIVQYLQTKKNCPICRVQIHKTRPLQNVRPDRTLQDLVYKLVPGVFRNEMMRRRQYYEKHPSSGPDGTSTGSEDRGEIVDPEHAIFAEDDKISTALVHSLDGKPVVVGTSGQVLNHARQAGGVATSQEQSLGVVYLNCPAMVPIGVLKKFLRGKYGLKDEEVIVDIFQSDESLSDEYTLMDIAYIYSWRRRGPLTLFFTIYKFRPPARVRSSIPISVDDGAESVQPCLARSRLADSPSTQEEPLNMSKKRRLTESDAEQNAERDAAHVLQANSRPVPEECCSSAGCSTAVPGTADVRAVQSAAGSSTATSTRCSGSQGAISGLAAPPTMAGIGGRLFGERGGDVEGASRALNLCINKRPSR